MLPVVSKNVVDFRVLLRDQNEPAVRTPFPTAPFDRPALDKRAGRPEYRNDEWRFGAPVLCRCREGGLKYEGRRKKEELGKRQNLWRRFAYSLHIRVRAFSVFGDQAFDPRRHNGERYGAELEHGIVESTDVEFCSERFLRSRGE